jgi:hypothetical protein
MTDPSAPEIDHAALRRWRNALLGRFGVAVGLTALVTGLSGMPAWGFGLAAGAAASGLAFFMRVGSALRMAEGGPGSVNRLSASGTVSRMLTIGVVLVLAYKHPALDFAATAIGAFGMQIFLAIAVMLPGSAGIVDGQQGSN